MEFPLPQFVAWEGRRWEGGIFSVYITTQRGNGRMFSATVDEGEGKIPRYSPEYRMLSRAKGTKIRIFSARAFGAREFPVYRRA